jgi:DNA-directed RNA polymerase
MEVAAKVGVALLKLLADAARVEPRGGGAPAPAFWHEIQTAPAGGGHWKKYGVLRAHPEVVRHLRPGALGEAVMPHFLPMVVPPVPWQRHDLGGHLTLRSSVMRVRAHGGAEAQTRRLEAADAEMVAGAGPGLSRVYDALNALGATPWRINRRVFAVLEAVWAYGGGVCGVPPRADVPVPPPLPAGFRLQRLGGGAGPLAAFARPRAEVRARRAEAYRARKRNNERHSLRCDAEYKLAIAREFSREPRFFFPHNVDFRGRAYPLHPHLNHLGQDFCRGVLEFAEARPLGPDGLRWLFIQAANLWGQGVDKLPLDGRVAWVEARLPALLADAADPLGPGSAGADGVGGGSGAGGGGGADAAPPARDFAAELAAADAAAAGAAEPPPRWWRADDPFQYLAAVTEIAAALAAPDPAAFASRLPVHQDGSCNGLQHYAALGRDATGGWAVNLCPAGAPQDVYAAIAREVAARVAADAAAGVPEAALLLASTPVDRKLVKQTVMTSVYGVTFVGARAQIGNRLRERGFDDSREMYRVSVYSARAALECLHAMFHSAKHIMAWLSEAARLVADADRSMAWTTPLGLPVVQPYRKRTRHSVRTVLQRLVLEATHEASPVLAGRQRTAFPPNFIHSVDSTHMMLTALRCREAGLAFAGVHDSFWTHAGSVGEMSATLRDAFVELHGAPLLERLRDELAAEHPDIEFPPLPPRGELDLEEVRAATYFFS